MSGLILVFIIGLWAVLVQKLTTFLSQWIPASNFSSLFKMMLYLFIFITPLADDIVGGFQFRTLCNSGYYPKFSEIKAKNKLVKLKQIYVQHKDQNNYTDIPRRDINNSIIPIYEESWEYIDNVTGETLLSWKEYHAKGGWLSRLIGFPQGAPPYTFNAVCSTESNYSLLKQLNMTVVN